MALDQIFYENKHITCRDPDFDAIIACCRRRLESTNIKWEPVYIEGHQDDDTPYEKLDSWAKLNCDMDRQAKDRWQAENRPGMKPPLTHQVYLAPWTFQVNGSTIIKSFKSRMREHCLSYDAMKHWTTKDQFSTATPEAVDWDAMEMAMSSMKPSQRRECSKHATSFFATGKRMQTRGERDTAECPFQCGKKIETKTHVIKCAEKDPTAEFNKAIKAVQNKLIELKTDPDVTDAIIEGICS